MPEFTAMRRYKLTKEEAGKLLGIFGDITYISLFGELESMGHASNGEQFFRPKTRPEGVVSSKEGVLW